MKIQVLKPTGRIGVEAEVFGIYAVHPSIDRLDDGWRVTHVPTGMRLRASEHLTPAEARAVARLLADRLPDLTLQTCTAENGYIAESCFAEALS